MESRSYSLPFTYTYESASFIPSISGTLENHHSLLSDDSLKSSSASASHIVSGRSGLTCRALGPLRLFTIGHPSAVHVIGSSAVSLPNML